MRSEGGWVQAGFSAGHGLFCALEDAGVDEDVSQAIDVADGEVESGFVVGCFLGPDKLASVEDAAIGVTAFGRVVGAVDDLIGSDVDGEMGMGEFCRPQHVMLLELGEMR